MEGVVSEEPRGLYTRKRRSRKEQLKPHSTTNLSQKSSPPYLDFLEVFDTNRGIGVAERRKKTSGTSLGVLG
jgi:hypothetical protein